MGKHTGTVVGVVLLVLVCWLVVATQRGQSGHGDVVVSIHAASPAPDPPTLTTTATPTTSSPSPQAWDQAIGGMARTTIIAWLLALAILPLFALAGIALRARYRSKLLELDHPPLRQPEFMHRAYDVKALEARRGWLPESFTYSPHLRQDTAEVVEEPPQLNGPLPSAEALVAMPGLAYGVRVDNGEPLVDHDIRSLLVGGQMGAGKSTLVALLGAQLHQMGARLVVGDPHASNPQGLSARMRTLIDHFELEQEPRQIFHRVMGAWNELERRERLGDPRGLPPHVVIVDEFAELLRRLDDRDEERLRDALLLIGGLSGRKFKVATIVMSQSWKHSVVRSTEMRDVVSTQAVFRMRKDEALRMTNLGSDYWNSDPLLLQKGEAFIVGVLSGAVLVRVPPVEAPTRAPMREALSPNRTLVSMEGPARAIP